MPRWQGRKDLFDHKEAHETEMRLVGIRCPRKEDFPVKEYIGGPRMIFDWGVEQDVVRE